MEHITIIDQAHFSADTAYLVADYPYGFTLRCKIRYWLEYSPKRGFRFVSQTTNPKLPGEVWNKPKASTYHTFAAMGLDELGHVTYQAIGQWNLEDMRPFLEANRALLSPDQIAVASRYARVKELYEAFKAAGDPFQVAGKKAAVQHAMELDGKRADWHVLKSEVA